MQLENSQRLIKTYIFLSVEIFILSYGTLKMGRYVRKTEWEGGKESLGDGKELFVKGSPLGVNAE